MHKVLKHFEKYDPVLYAYARRVGDLAPLIKEKPENYFQRLCREIVGQQLHSKAAHAIFGRFKKLFPRGVINPKKIISLSHKVLRKCGLSRAKAKYIKNLAEQITSGSLDIKKLDAMADEEAIAELIKVKGIGRWTAEMFLIFALGREDIFSYGDFALKKGMQKIYKLKKTPSKNRAEEIIKHWSPHKTYASRVLWASLRLE